MSDCAVQYVVTIINSSDDSVYPNITTSDTNTTVTLPTGVEFCVTVLRVDSINRTGPASEPQCYTIAPTSTSSGMSTVYQTLPAISVTTSTSPTVSPVLVGGVNAAAVAVPIVLILLLVVIATVVGVVLLVYFSLLLVRKGHTKVISAPGHGIKMNGQRTESDQTESFFKKIDMTVQTVDETLLPSPDCMCQVFYYKMRLNCWRIVFAFFPKEQLDKVKQLYSDAECGPSVDELVFQHEVIEIKYPTVVTGWKISVPDNLLSVRRANMEGYTGEGNPPVIELTIRAVGEKELRGDLHCDVTLMGVKLSHITIERMYEQSPSQPTKPPPPTKQSPPPSLPIASSAPNSQSAGDDGIASKSVRSSSVRNPSAGSMSDKPKPGITSISVRSSSVRNPSAGGVSDKPNTGLNDGIKCVCQVFYLRQGINYWKIRVAFYTREYIDDMKAFYQNASIGECVDVQFKDRSTPIRLSPQYVRGVIASGWAVTVEQKNDCNQVTTAAVEQYTGEGEPPYCEMTLRAIDDNTTHHANFTVTLNGARPPKNIKILRKLEFDDVPPNPTPDSVDLSESREYVCQVLYAKYGTNTWKVIFSFIPKGNLEEVKKRCYSSDELGPTVDVQLNKEIVKVSVGKASNGWSYDPYYEQVKRADIVAYTGVGKPPYCEMTLRAANGSTPPDLTLPVTLTGLKQPTTITLERVATADVFGKPEQDLYDSAKYMCQIFYHKLEGTNLWKATLAFFTKEKQTNVNTVYQSEVTGPTAEFQFKRGSNSSVKIGFKKLKTKEWNVTLSPEHNTVTRAAVDAYDRSGSYTTDKPPYCEMILRAVSDSTPPPDLTVSFILTGGNLLQPIILERKAEHPSL